MHDLISKIVGRIQKDITNLPASEDVGDEREFVPGNIDLLCPTMKH